MALAILQTNAERKREAIPASSSSHHAGSRITQSQPGSSWEGARWAMKGPQPAPQNKKTPNPNQTTSSFLIVGKFARQP